MLALGSLSITFLEDVGNFNVNSITSLQHFSPMVLGRGRKGSFGEDASRFKLSYGLFLY